jgi:hypothetical protein
VLIGSVTALRGGWRYETGEHGSTP